MVMFSFASWSGNLLPYHFVSVMHNWGCKTMLPDSSNQGFKAVIFPSPSWRCWGWNLGTSAPKQVLFHDSMAYSFHSGTHNSLWELLQTMNNIGGANKKKVNMRAVHHYAASMYWMPVIGDTLPYEGLYLGLLLHKDVQGSQIALSLNIVPEYKDNVWCCLMWTALWWWEQIWFIQHKKWFISLFVGRDGWLILRTMEQMLETKCLAPHYQSRFPLVIV